uniref:DUF7133 domain-containing protein n=1 Tax=Prosthecobacter sp. TaxID=1965333 RepID=UPI0037C5EB35
KWNYSYFTTEPTLNIVSHFFVEKDGVTYKAHREAGREKTEFIRSKDLWFRPIENRVGPDGALYVVDFYNQAVIHNDTRGPIHGPANAAVRPDRDHYFGRIWKVQHKQATKVVKKDKNLQASMGSDALKAYEAAQKAVKTDAGREQVLKDFAAAKEDWSRSALIAACADQAQPSIEAALAHGGSEAFVAALLPAALPAGADKLISACANADAKADALKIVILQGITQQLNDGPAITPELMASLKKILAQPALAAAALPLVVKWDKAGVLAAEVKAQIASLTAKLEDKAAAMGDRITAAKSLIGIGGEASALVVGALARPDSPAALQGAIIAAMDEKGRVTELVGNLNGLKAELRTQAFDAILKRPEASLALLSAIQNGKIDPKEIGPGNIARLRTHPNKQVAKQANAMIDKLNPNAKAKNELLAQLTPEVEKPGDAVKGKAMFAAACAVCHKLGDLGLRDVGPQLTGMGAHGPAELLVHIVDPNREVDPSFWAWNITTKKGETQAGVIITENQASLTLRNQVGDFEIKKDDIATRENTRRSLMPDGLDALGAETLRDILAFICGGEQKFRVIDLRTAYNADSRAGIFAKEDAKDQTVTLHKFGNVTVNGVPFFVMDPEKSQTGASLIALKGGGKGTVAENFPEKIEIATSATAASLHFLGGVAGWGWPFGGDKALGQPAMTVDVEFADGDKESIVLKNGEHFADYIGKAEVPLSDDAGDFTRRGQLRYFAINLKKKGALKNITLETSGSIVTPCTVAITASMEPAKLGGAAPKPKANGDVRGAPETGPKEGGKGDGPLVAVTPVQWESGKTKVLVIGGGSSHNFAKFFGETDVATLKAAGFTVHYTEDRDQAAAELANADVAVISVNRKFFDTAVYRKALFDFAAAGKGIIMLHPGTWYGFGGWPELNAQIVGGGARGHDKIHPFDVKAVKADHPIMAGVPASFTVEDELYYVNAEPNKTPAGTAKITVLAETSPSDKYKASHPSVWVTEHAKAKVVGIALGHDARVHDLKPYQQILTNAVKWASGK